MYWSSPYLYFLTIALLSMGLNIHVCVLSSVHVPMTPPPNTPPLHWQMSFFPLPLLTGMAAPKVACFGGLSPATVSQLIPIARLAYQGTLKDQLIFHGVSETIESLGMCVLCDLNVKMIRPLKALHCP